MVLLCHGCAGRGAAWVGMDEVPARVASLLSPRSNRRDFNELCRGAHGPGTLAGESLQVIAADAGGKCPPRGRRAGLGLCGAFTGCPKRKSGDARSGF